MRCAQAGRQLLRRDYAVAVLVQRVEDEIAARPFFAGDESITVEASTA